MPLALGEPDINAQDATKDISSMLPQTPAGPLSKTQDVCVGQIAIRMLLDGIMY